MPSTYAVLLRLAAACSDDSANDAEPPVAEVQNFAGFRSVTEDTIEVGITVPDLDEFVLQEYDVETDSLVDIGDAILVDR